MPSVPIRLWIHLHASVAGLAIFLAGCATHSAAPSAQSPAAQETTVAANTAQPSRAAPQALARRASRRDAYVREHYTKREVMIPMRDGVRLFTAIYEPKDASKTYPVLMFRTPYSCRPYGADKFSTRLGPNAHYAKNGYIFVCQDVRGKWMSEGEFRNMTPHVDDKKTSNDIDESSDAYDTIEWVLANVKHHNGRVGQWGISYPGFYSAASMIDAHPALKAVSPQAPIADWWYDDFHHHGAFFLPHAFGFLSRFGLPRPEPTKTRPGRSFSFNTQDGYQFYMNMGSLKNANERYLHGEVDFWNKTVEHPNYDEFWQSRNLLGHLRHVAPAVMTVGGWFDAEDLYGALQIYRGVEKQNPGIFNILVMGPWAHGGWNRSNGQSLGNVDFGAKTAEFYREKIELPFFEHFLRGAPDPKLPEAYVFETGANKWRTFDHWPPSAAQTRELFFRDDFGLAFDPPADASDAAFDEYVSDPAKPVPFTDEIALGMTRPYMTDDQRFAARRTDVLSYRTEVLSEDVTLAGPLTADLWVSTSGTASDWIVKLIDVFPPGASDSDATQDRVRMSNYHMMVRSEVIRGRFRNSNEHPEPFTPNEPAEVKLALQDVLHTFQKGHRIMIQVQSTWFPLVDRNPQKYVDNIYLAGEDDFIKATQRVYRGGAHKTAIRVSVLESQDHAAAAQ